MTVASTATRIFQEGNGVTTAFPVPFTFDLATDLRVSRVNASGAESVYAIGTDYTVSGGGGETGTVTFLVAPAVGYTVVIVRRTELTQDTTFASGQPFPATAHEAALDRLCRQVQDLRDDAARGIKIRGDQASTDPTAYVDYSLPLPQSGRLVVGRSDGAGWENRDAATIAGSPVTLPLSIAEGGTGQTTAANARTALGLGTAALLNSGTASGNVPVLGGGATLPTSTLPTLSSGVAGVVPAYGGTTNGLYISGTGWTKSYGSVTPLVQQVLSSPASTLQVAAAGTEWDIYEEFIVTSRFFMSAANSGARLYLNINGTWRNSAEYVYTGWTYAGGFYAYGANPGSPSDDMRVTGHVDDIGPDTVAKAVMLEARIFNLYKINSTYPSIIHIRLSFVMDSGTPVEAFVCGRAYAHQGYVRGLRIVTEDATTFAAASRTRIWGVDPGSF